MGNGPCEESKTMETLPTYEVYSVAGSIAGLETRHNTLEGAEESAANVLAQIKADNTDSADEVIIVKGYIAIKTYEVG